MMALDQGIQLLKQLVCDHGAQNNATNLIRESYDMHDFNPLLQGMGE